MSRTYIQDAVISVPATVRSPQGSQPRIFLDPVAWGKPLLTLFLSWGFLTSRRTHVGNGRLNWRGAGEPFKSSQRLRVSE